jgi:hypothetical protein
MSCLGADFAISNLIYDNFSSLKTSRKIEILI